MVALRTLPRQVVLVGAGHAHVEVLRSFATSPMADVRLTLVSRSRTTPYSGMLPGVVAGLYRKEDAYIDALALATAAGATFLRTEAVGIDLRSQHVSCRDGATLPYDIVSLDVGSTPNTEGVAGAAEHAIPVKPIDALLSRFEPLRARIRERPGRIVIVGGGAAGVELAFSVHRRLTAEAVDAGLRSRPLTFTLLCASDRILPEFPGAFRQRCRRILEDRGIEVLEDARVTAVLPGTVELTDGRSVAADETLWVTEAAAPSWLRASGLVVDERGFAVVDGTLRASGHDNIFAAGDVAAFQPRKLPKSGVYAVRQGPVLARNIRRLLAGETLAEYSPQRQTLYLLSTGERHAIGTRNGIVLEGDWVWSFKNWLDRRFVEKYRIDGAAPLDRGGARG